MAGDHRLPRSVISYTWGGTGHEARPFSSPYMIGLGQVFVLRSATTPTRQWFEEKIDIKKDWRNAFKGSAVPRVLEIMIGSDVDDTKARLDARVDSIRFAPC